MTTVMAEQIHRYPRHLRWIIELVSAIAVALSTFFVGREVLRYFWRRQDVDEYFIRRFRPLRGIVDWLDVRRLEELQQPIELSHLIPYLTLLAIVLLLTLLLRNAFPTIRTSPVGMLIEFAGDWMPIRWEEVATVKATQSPAGGRYVLLVQTRKKALTGWHRFYSFIYRLGWRRGFFVTSSIQSFDVLVKTVLYEADRVAKIMDLPPARLDERAISPHFQFLLSPVGFFSRRTVAEQVAAPAPIPVPAPVVTEQGVLEAIYPERIKRFLNAALIGIGILALLRYLGYWRVFIGTLWTRGPTFFTHAAYPPPESSLWVLIAGHLMLALLIPALLIVWALLPDLRAHADGLAVRYLNRWVLIPWQRITRLDAADLSEHNHVLLVETAKQSLPFWYRAVSLLFDGRRNPGVIITSAISNFEPLLQRILMAVSRMQPQNPDDPIFRDNAPAWGVRMLLTPSVTIDRLVADVREDESTQTIDLQRAKEVMRIPALLALMPALILLATILVEQAGVPTAGRIGVIVAFFIWGLLEWPLAATLATVVEANPGIEAEQARPYYLYPLVQLPRLLPMGLAYILTLVGIPFLPTMLWLVAAGWSFLLTAGLWEEMYDWHGPKLLLMGMIPAIFQLLTLMAYGVLI